MNMLLLIVTVISFVAAVFLGWTAWRLSRAEQERAMARVAALAAAVAESAPVQPRPEPDAPAPAVEAAGAIAGVPQWSAPARPRRVTRIAAAEPAAEEIVWAPPRPEELHPTAHQRVGDSQLHPDLALVVDSAQVPAVRDAFLASPAASHTRSGQGVLAVAAVLLLFALGAAGVWMYSTPGTTAATPVAQQAPLELMSLGHAREGDRLSVRGLVRNPAAAPVVDRLSATVLLFDQHGGYLTSVREEIDVPHLEPGQESPFTLSIQAPAAAARYRVSFRTDERIVPHVDRRGETPAAASADQSQTTAR